MFEFSNDLGESSGVCDSSVECDGSHRTEDQAGVWSHGDPGPSNSVDPQRQAPPWHTGYQGY